MKEETFVILGLPVRIRYTIHSKPYFVEWYVLGDVEAVGANIELLEQLLRVHYTQWIEKTILELEWERSHGDTTPDPEMF